MPHQPNRYYPNNIVRFATTITASGNNPINPTPFAAVFLDTVSSIDTNSIINPSCGFFYFDFEVETPGILGYRWTMEGSHKAQSFGAVQVNTVPWS